MMNERTKKICKGVAIVTGVVAAVVAVRKFLHWIEPVDDADNEDCDEDEEFCLDE